MSCSATLPNLTCHLQFSWLPMKVVISAVRGSSILFFIRILNQGPRGEDDRPGTEADARNVSKAD